MNDNTMITVLVVEPGKSPYEKQIMTDLNSLQEEVDGYIQCTYPFDDPVAILCNDEGKIMGLPLNRALYDEKGNLYDVIAGTFLIVQLSLDSFTSLSKELSKKYTEQFRYPEIFYWSNGSIAVHCLKNHYQNESPDLSI
jgi:hypothetical protein